MERYFPVSKSSRSKSEKLYANLSHPYRRNRSAVTRSHKWESATNTFQTDANFRRRILLQQNCTPSPNKMTKFLLETLDSKTNPITHSDIGHQSDHIVSVATGHQVADNCRVRRLYLKDREHKLANQIVENSVDGQVLKGVHVYINGFLENTTDTEIKAAVLRAGGQILPSLSKCTHILMSPLCNSKFKHQFRTSKIQNKHCIVKPEWVWDSIKAKRRQPERPYLIVTSPEARTMQAMFDTVVHS